MQIQKQNKQNNNYDNIKSTKTKQNKHGIINKNKKVEKLKLNMKIKMDIYKNRMESNHMIPAISCTTEVLATDQKVQAN
jgi:hypothetical protein